MRAGQVLQDVAGAHVEMLLKLPFATATFTSPDWAVLPYPTWVKLELRPPERWQQHQGFPGREQLGGLELQLLHRDVSGHGASLGRSPPDQAARGFTCPAPLWRRVTDLVYAICQTYCTVTTVHYPFRDSQCRRVPTNLGESRQGLLRGRRLGWWP